MDNLPFTVFEVVEGEFPWCAEANSESGFWVACAYVLEDAALFARGSDGAGRLALSVRLCRAIQSKRFEFAGRRKRREEIERTDEVSLGKCLVL